MPKNYSQKEVFVKECANRETQTECKRAPLNCGRQAFRLKGSVVYFPIYSCQFYFISQLSFYYDFRKYFQIQECNYFVFQKPCRLLLSIVSSSESQWATKKSHASPGSGQHMAPSSPMQASIKYVDFFFSNFRSMLKFEFQAYVLFGQYLLLKKDEDLFIEWLKETAGVTANHAKTAFNCLNEWADQFM